MTKKVIIADDDYLMRTGYEGIIRRTIRAGYIKDVEVDLVPDGETLVGKVRQAKYDLIITDNQMPIMDGLEAIKQIREFDKVTPLYMASASNIAEQALKLGATGYIDKKKPVKEFEDQFRQIIIQYLSQ